MHRFQIHALACSLTVLATSVSAQGPNYGVQPVPPNFTQDSNTTFLVDLTTIKTQADYAVGNCILTLNPTNFEVGAGYTGPVGFSTAGNWPTNTPWTVEMLIRVPYISAVTATNSPIGLLHWESDPQQCLFYFNLDPGFGVESRLYSWNSGNGYFFSQPYAGGNGYTVQASAADEWVYIGVGCDFSNHFFMTAARSASGDILNSNINFASSAGTTNSAAAWAAMQGYFNAGMPGNITFGTNLVQVQAIKISNVYKTNLFSTAPLLPQASPTNWIPATLDSTRATNRIVTRTIGYPGYNNFISEPITESYIELTNGSAPVSIQLTNLSYGLYTFYVWGTIDAQGRTNLPVVWQRCPMRFMASTASTNLMTAKMPLKQRLYPNRMQGYSFHLDIPTNTTTNVAVTFSVDTNAMESAQILWINLFNQMASSPMVAVKTAQTLATGPTNQYTSLPAGWQTHDDAIWYSLPPLGVPFETGAAAGWQTPPTNVDTWITAAFNGVYLWDQPLYTFSRLDFLDTNTSVSFPQANILKFVPLPEANYPDDRLGVYYSTNKYPWLTSAMYNTTGAQLLGNRYLLYFGSIVSSEGSLYGLQNAQQYFNTGIASYGHDAALALVRFAYDWPALEMSLQQLRCLTTTSDPDYGTDWSNPAIRNGKLLYVGWSGSDALWLFTAYDQVFPYINGNQLFANEVHRYVPWVNTPHDVIKLLDNYLVFPSIRDVNIPGDEEGGLIDPTAGVPEAAGHLLGPSPYTDPVFDLTHQYAVIYPTSGGTYQEMYGTALSRSGTEYVGSFMVYGFGSAAATIQQASMIQWAKANGVPVPMDLSDVTKYPKVRGAGNYLLDMWVAGGFPFMIGDASGGPHSSLFTGQANAMTVLGAAIPTLNQAFNLYGDPRLAWLLKNDFGTTNSGIAVAATGLTDPILHATSRVVPDWGAILEMEPDETNLLNKTSATVRLGVGQGHAHSDYLDLNLFAMGMPLAVNLACRNEGPDWSMPPASWSLVSNHALSHSTLDESGAGTQTGEPWLEAFAPPLVRGSYNDGNGSQLDRQVFLMQIGNTNVYYAFDVQWLTGGTYHTWAFHGCESSNLLLNTPMSDGSSYQWLDDDLPGTQLMGPGTNWLQAVWTMTRSASTITYPTSVYGGGTFSTVACEQTVLGTNYNASLPPEQVRATLLGRGNDTVLQGNPYSAEYQYCFPFLWSQTSNETVSTYPAVYDWYRGTPLVSNIVLLGTNPVQVQVTAAAQTDTYKCTPDYFLVVSRGTNGVRYAKLDGYTAVSLPDLTLTPGTNYAVTITSINYRNRTLTTSGPLPRNPLVTVGNSGRKVSLQLYGSGMSFSFGDDLMVLEGRINSLHITSSNTISITLDQNLLFDGYGNRHSTNMVLTTEDGQWHFRNNTVIASPANTPLTADVFTDANGDGLVDAKIYEIGEGDTVSLPADITVQRTSNGWQIMTNVPLGGSVQGAAFNLSPSSAWQALEQN
jgi:hypothetical protein